MPGVYSTAKYSKYTRFASTILKKKLKSIFAWWQKHVRNTGRDIITTHIDMTWRKQVHGTALYLCANPWFAPPAIFLNATWRQGIFSVMQAMKAT